VIFFASAAEGTKKKTHVRYTHNRDTAGLNSARDRERERENRERLGERERNKDTFFDTTEVFFFVLAKEREREREKAQFSFSFLFPKVSQEFRERIPNEIQSSFASFR